jgi:hypothetical protein
VLGLTFLAAGGWGFVKGRLADAPAAGLKSDRSAAGQSEPVPPAFDFEDPRRALHWWIKKSEEAPYPLAEDTHNALRDRSRHQWHLDRTAMLQSRPVSWHFKVAEVDHNGLVRLEPVYWPLDDAADVKAWSQDRAVEWPKERSKDLNFRLWSLSVARRDPKAPGAEPIFFFPTGDPKWAATLTPGTEVRLTGRIEEVRGIGFSPDPFSVLGGKKDHDMLGAIITDGRVTRLR